MNLGAIEQPYNYRDIQLGRIQKPVEIPEELIPDYSSVPKYFQGQQPACSSHAGTFGITLNEYLENGYVSPLSPRYMWRKIKDIDGYPLHLGSDLRSILKVMASEATCSNMLLPNEINKPLDIYSNPTIIDAMRYDAQPRIVASYAFLDDISFDGVKQAIFKNKFAILLIHCDEGFFGTTTPTFTSKKYGHFVVAIGYTKNGIIIVDSTEEDTLKSTKFMDKKYVDFIRQGGTVVDIPNEQVKELTRKIVILEQLVSLYTKLYKLLK